MILKPGRYQATINGQYVVACMSCDHLDQVDAGRSGVAVMPKLLRSMGWTMVGERSSALWRCPGCSGRTARPQPVRRSSPTPRAPKATTPQRDALPRIIGRPRDPVDTTKEDAEQCQRVQYHEPCWYCGAARGCEHRE